MDTLALPKLKLIASDSDGLMLLSAHLQDAFLPPHSLLYDEKERTFRALCNRFCWEHENHQIDDKSLYYRTHSGLCFQNVRAVHYKGFRRDKDMDTLNLLAIHHEEKSDCAMIYLLFSMHHAIRLEVDNLLCQLQDIEHPWPTHQKPQHIS